MRLEEDWEVYVNDDMLVYVYHKPTGNGDRCGNAIFSEFGPHLGALLCLTCGEQAPTQIEGYARLVQWATKEERDQKWPDVTKVPTT